MADGILGFFGDSLQNLVTRLGTMSDKATHSTFFFQPMSRIELSAAYRGDWVARKGIQLPAQDATREWRTWSGDPEQVRLIEETEKRLDIRRKVYEAFIFGRLFGGGALVMGIMDQDASTPLVAAVPRDSLVFVNVLDHDHLIARELNRNPLSPGYGEPSAYTITADGIQYTLDGTRVVRIVPNPVIDVDQDVQTRWGDSTLDAVSDAVRNVATIMAASATLVHELNIDVVKIPGFLRSVGDADYEKRIIDRFRIATQGKSVANTLLLDEKDEWERIATSMTGIPDIIESYLMIVSGAFDIPATRMLGQSPKGMNATGESDLENYYEAVASNQRTFLQPALRPLDNAIVQSSLGVSEWPDDLSYTWDALKQQSEKELAETRKLNAEAFKLDADSALIPDEILVRGRLDQLEQDEQAWPNVLSLREEFGEDPQEREPLPEPGPPASGGAGGA